MLEEKYMKDPKCKQYESFEDWLDDKDIDDIVEWADSYVKSLIKSNEYNLLS